MKNLETESAAQAEYLERWELLKLKVQEAKIKDAFRLFRERGFEPILIKGWAAAKEYPSKHKRVFNDIDLCVEPAAFEKCEELVSTEEAKKLNIDLHRGLRHLDSLDWEELFERSELVELDGESIRVLCPEDHLRVLCVHWLTDGGAFKERLLDIRYLIENQQNSFDWEKCLGNMSETRKSWITKTIGAAHLYFDLDISMFPWKKEAENLPRWFKEALEKEWESGVKLLPIHRVLGDRKEFFRQLKKRFPPNPIQATIDVEAPIDETGRAFYQIGSIFLRVKPSIKRIFWTIGMEIRRRFLMRR